MSAIFWKREDTFDVGNVKFVSSSREAAESEGAIFIMKSRPLLDLYEDIFQKINPKKIVEVGCLGGGSAIYLNERLDPDAILMIDLIDQTTPGFRSYFNNSAKANRLRPHLNVDQADGAKIRELMRSEFGEVRADFIIDDASRLYNLSKSTFEHLFPTLREGGLYVIEDWGWGNWQGKYWQEEDTDWKHSPALTNLIFELVMASASRPDLVRKVVVTYSGCVVERGSDMSISPGDSMETYYVNRGKQLSLI